MDIQVPLMIIDRRGVSIMSILFANRRVTHLRFDDAFERRISENTLDSTEIVSGKFEIAQGVFRRMVVNRINK